MGRPSPGYNIELLNADRKVCEAGEEGEIVINTAKGVPSVCYFYLHRCWHSIGVYSAVHSQRQVPGMMPRACRLAKPPGAGTVDASAGPARTPWYWFCWYVVELSGP
jgi:hypothetical protein